MKKLYFLMAIFIPCIVAAQSGKKKNQIDSGTYYSGEMKRLWRERVDTLYNSPEYKELQSQYNNYLKKSKNYSSAVLFFDIFHSDYSDFNAILAQEGFPALQDMGGRVGFGSSHRTNRGMVDIYFFTAGFNNKSKKGNETVKTSFSSVFQFDLGYDLLDLQNFSIYPYAGLSFRISSIRYEKSGETNPAYTSIFDMRSDANNFTLESYRVGYQYGLGVDWAFSKNTDHQYKTILFIKAGANRPVWKDSYRDGAIRNYKPAIKQGDWMISVGCKFANLR